MDSIIDIDALIDIDKNDDFVELLFGKDAFNRNVEIYDGRYEIECDGTKFIIRDDGTIGFYEDFRADYISLVPNAFQIVRYIDNYLATLK